MGCSPICWVVEPQAPDWVLVPKPNVVIVAVAWHTWEAAPTNRLLIPASPGTPTLVVGTTKYRSRP